VITRYEQKEGVGLKVRTVPPCCSSLCLCSLVIVIARSLMFGSSGSRFPESWFGRSSLQDLDRRSLSRTGRSGEAACVCSSLRISDSSLSHRQDTPCVLKVVVSPEELQKLRKEKGILETIRQRDRLGEANRYLVSCWLLPSSELLDQESIYFLDASGDRISPPRFSGMTMPTGLRLQGIVLESGGCNLQEYLKLEENSYSSVPVTQRLQILSEIVAAVSFLHKMGIVHFDLKPENVVNFICGPSQRTRWKLIDLDECEMTLPQQRQRRKKIQCRTKEKGRNGS
jgi:hypothetical protein